MAADTSRDAQVAALASIIADSGRHERQTTNGQIDTLVAMLEEMRPTAPTSARVLVPGQMVATYTDGKIAGWTFSPSASDAGYFGPSATIIDYDETDYTGDGVDPDLFDVEDGGSLFWCAVRDDLLASGVEWTE